MADEKPTKEVTPAKKGYGGRPSWQWVALYVVAGAVLYYIIYLLFFSSGDDGGLY